MHFLTKQPGYYFVWAILLNRLSLEFVGLWPKTDGITKGKLDSDIRVGFSFIMLTFALGIPMVHALIRVSGDMTLMIDNLRITIFPLTILLELIIFRWKQTVLSSIINMIAEDWLSLKQRAERDVMMKRAWTTRLLIFYIFIALILGYVLVIIIPYFHIPFRHLSNLTDRNKPLPFQTYYLYDTDKSPQFELTFLTQAIALFQALMIHFGVQTFLIFMIFHICGQLENFKNQMLNLLPCKQFNTTLSSIVITHLRLIRYVNNTENIFTSIMFLMVLQFIITFCLCGYLLLTFFNDGNVINMTNISQLSYMAVGVIFILIQTFLYCLGGDLITEHYDEVFRSICDLKWYKLERRQAKNLILPMLVTEKPFCITAGKIFPLTMSTFCSLLKTAAGYISLLLTMQN
ncbi:Odorant receptor 151 [Nylanderia fulva]|uniref:Odorant receptor n=1 Tax=Nylanderia fulva TaxID=613905 RepID=A0A6G1LQA5_9HYME|nr:Odorant receptor 151 [Nylanderia fulva]